VVDTFGALAGLGGEEENNSASVTTAVEPLKRAAARGLAVVIVAHQRKGGGGTVDSVRGSSALAAAVDIIFVLKETSRGRRVLDGVSRFGGLSRLALDGGSEGTSGQGRERRDRAAEERQLVALIGEGCNTVPQLVERTGMPDGTVRTRLSALNGREVTPVDGEGVKGSPTVWGLILPDSVSARGNGVLPLAESSS
jgi:hypothetical protein